MKKLHIALGALSLAMFFSCTKDIQQDATTNDAAGSAANSNAVAENASDPFVPNEILVKFKVGVSEDTKNEALARIGGQVSERLFTKAMKHFGDNEGIYLVNTSLNALEAISKIKGLEIEYAEPNWIYTHDATSNDSYYKDGSLWGMYGDATSPANQYGSQAGEAWAAGHTGSAGVYIGVIDEGIQFTHPDLDANVWNNPKDAADGVDNDGNGYVDDIHGWDFAGNNNTIYDGGTRGGLDDHGTHVTGTIGGEGGNGIGVVGVNWTVTYISGKFLGRMGGTTANAIKAVDYFTDLKTRHGLNIVATNNSWGGGGFSQGLYDAISRTNAANILFIAAAGNSGTDNDVTASYPSNYNLANVIAVAAIDKFGALASFSQYGATTVDLGAPGVGVWSTTAFKTYSSYNGTSMATPHVTGAAALYASTHPGSSAATIKAAILNSAVPTASLAGKCVTGGRLNVSSF
jgi:subtilisin family serine protease